MVSEPTPSRRRTRVLVATLGVAACVAGALAIGGGMAARAQIAPAPAEYTDTAIRLGFQVWKTKVWCGQCHGWDGNGIPDDPRAPVGANLREAVRTPEQIAETIRCGIPGTEMPAFDALAYTDTRCYGVTRAQLGAMTPPSHGVALIAREVNGLIAYLFTNVIGKGPFTDADCRAYYGQDAAICDVIRAGNPAQPPQVTPP